MQFLDKAVHLMLPANKHRICILYIVPNLEFYPELYVNLIESNTVILSSEPTIKQVSKTMEKLNHNTNFQRALGD